MSYLLCTIICHAAIYQGGKLKKFPPTKHPKGWDWNTFYDGILGNENKSPEGVWFTTTLNNGAFPTITPYPTGETQGQRYWRLFIKLDHLKLHDDERWHLYFIKEAKLSNTTERVIAFVNKNNAKYFEESKRSGATRLNKKLNPYMKYEEISVNDYQTRMVWKCPKQPIWTKVFINDDIVLSNLEHPHMFWDTVTKKGGY